MRSPNRAVGFVLLALLALTACRKQPDPATPARTVAVAPPPGGGAATAAVEPAYSAPPPLPATARPPVNEALRFNTPEPMNMYAPRYAGDYQAQLDAYNRVLRKWLADSSNAPRNLQEIMGTFNSPKPPQPPVGRRLVYDPATFTVSSQ